MIGLPKLTILGGSSPFTIEMINCLVSAGIENKVGPYNLVLFGRNLTNLQLIANYGSYHLSDQGWEVEFSTDITRALYGADIVIHQNRYGGLEGRLDDETFSARMEIPADETLGPSGLKSALRMAPYLKVLAQNIRSFCPAALIINLTNPLSIAVSLLHYWGVSNVIGICELPLATVKKAACLLQIPFTQLNWEYSGLNHRGFIHDLKFNNEDLFPILLEKITGSGFQGSPSSVLEGLEAIPLKYFRLISHPGLTKGRAIEVKTIGDNIIEELIIDPFKPPPSVKMREMQWYKDGIIDVLTAVNSSDPEVLVINKPTENNLTIESKAKVSNRAVTLIKPAKSPAQVQKWLDVFIEHETETFKAALDPSLTSISRALASDPLVKRSDVIAISHHLLNNYLKENAEINT